jgi:mannitol/fructose-specific phosphotransferase system IIA component (Ntr-type)
MKLKERLNVLVQATTLSQKSGVLTLDEAVNAKNAIDLISTGVLNQNYITAINTLIEIAIASQKKGAYSLKDAHMVYLAIDGIENEFQNEVNKINGVHTEKETRTTQDMSTNSGETIISVPPKKMKGNS